MKRFISLFLTLALLLTVTVGLSSVEARADGLAAGQVVMHAHLHVVPRGVEDDFHWNWRQLAYPEGKMAEIAEATAKRLKLN